MFGLRHGSLLPDGCVCPRPLRSPRNRCLRKGDSDQSPAGSRRHGRHGRSSHAAVPAEVISKPQIVAEWMPGGGAAGSGSYLAECRVPTGSPPAIRGVLYALDKFSCLDPPLPYRNLHLESPDLGWKRPKQRRGDADQLAINRPSRLLTGQFLLSR